MGRIEVHEFMTLDAVIDAPPLAVGSGRRLFPDGGPAVRPRLEESEAYPSSGVLHLSYSSYSPAA